MFKFVALLLAFVNAASAFAPASRVRSSSIKMAFAEGLPGNAGPELKNFDPLKFSEKSPEWVPWFREAELKHGRVAMLATLGWVAVDLGFTLPNHSGSSLAAHNTAVSSGAMIQILLWIGLLEIISVPAIKTAGRAPGDFSFDPLGFGKDAKKLEVLKVNELKNGRLAMMAFSGIVTQAALTGKSFPDLSYY